MSSIYFPTLVLLYILSRNKLKMYQYLKEEEISGFSFSL